MSFISWWMEDEDGGGSCPSCAMDKIVIIKMMFNIVVIVNMCNIVVVIVVIVDHQVDHANAHKRNEGENDHLTL